MNDNLDWVQIHRFDAALSALTKLNNPVQEAALDGRRGLTAKEQQHFCTVRLCAGANSGKTTWIAHTAGPADVVFYQKDGYDLSALLGQVKTDPSEWPAYLPLNYIYLPGTSLPRFDWHPAQGRARPYRRVFIDDASYLAADVRDRIYDEVAVWNDNPSGDFIRCLFVLVG